jgi:hypothetical protein
MFGSSQVRNINQSTFIFKQIEVDVGLSSSAKAFCRKLKRSEEYYIL